jgi:hypothetical protein
LAKLTKHKLCMYTIQMVGEKELVKAACGESAKWVSGRELYFCDEHFPRGLETRILKELKLRAVR